MIELDKSNNAVCENDDSTRSGSQCNGDRPKLVFDKDYSTSWVREQQWLTQHGIRYSCIKYIDGVTTFKYKKTVALFASLADFCRDRGMYY